eukprot:TRINITY_DN2867_c0_g1_i1.p2 TRINITY_DN2867_c0_g1~~TRINITY_DN2867_c0_g1_i1.p2  ORF type:complete len:225 (+),score=44.87 TRINITY_DN2867_c0_g1_i1:1118-1792(+)
MQSQEPFGSVGSKPFAGSRTNSNANVKIEIALLPEANHLAPGFVPPLPCESPPLPPSEPIPEEEGEIIVQKEIPPPIPSSEIRRASSHYSNGSKAFFEAKGPNGLSNTPSTLWKDHHSGDLKGSESYLSNQQGKSNGTSRNGHPSYYFHVHRQESAIPESRTTEYEPYDPEKTISQESGEILSFSPEPDEEVEEELVKIAVDDSESLRKDSKLIRKAEKKGIYY